LALSLFSVVYNVRGHAWSLSLARRLIGFSRFSTPFRKYFVVKDNDGQQFAYVDNPRLAAKPLPATRRSGSRQFFGLK